MDYSIENTKENNFTIQGHFCCKVNTFILYPSVFLFPDDVCTYLQWHTLKFFFDSSQIILKAHPYKKYPLAQMLQSSII